MKRIFSTLIVLCMAFSMTVLAEDTGILTMTADKTSAKAGDTIEYTISVSKYEGYGDLQQATIVMDYPSDKISIVENSGILDSAFSGYTRKNKFSDTGSMFRMELTADTQSDNLVSISNTTVIGKFTVKVKDTVVAGDTISFTKKTATAIMGVTGSVGKKKTVQGISMPTTITIKSSEPTVTKPTTVGSDNGGIVADPVKDGDNYVIAPIAPIGKKVVVKDATGTPITPNKKGEYTFTGNIDVTFDDDNDPVITYVIPMSEIYGDEAGIAAFGKGTIAEGDKYGIHFKDISAENNTGLDADIPAKWNVGGIFAVEIHNATAGDYTAQAYINDATGDVVEFTK